MKKFFNEFKKFISRGNVIDLAVGVIIGSAFTAIVTALTTNILQPLINGVIYLISGKENSLEGVYTFLVGSSADLENAIYINWGAFIGAIINFFLVALVLFIIVKAINRLQEESSKIKKEVNKGFLSKEDRKELKNRGIKLTDAEKIKAYILEKEQKEKELLDKEEADKKAKEEQDRKDNPTETDLLKDIKSLLEKMNK